MQIASAKTEDFAIILQNFDIFVFSNQKILPNQSHILKDNYIIYFERCMPNSFFLSFARIIH